MLFFLKAEHMSFVAFLFDKMDDVAANVNMLTLYQVTK